MQLKKHNSKTPPERKPKWLRKGIALLAAIATLATGGIVASTAYAGGGGGSQPGSGSGGPDGAPKVFWQYRDDASGSFGPASDINSVKKAFEAARVTLHEDSGGMTPMTKAKAALDGAKNECVEGFHRRHPGEGDGDCRVVAVGAMYSDSGYWGSAFDNGNYAELGNKNQWQYVWDKYIKNTKFNYAGSRGYYVTSPFNDDPNNSVQKIMWDKTFDGQCKVNPAWGSDVCNLGGAAVNKSIVVIVLDKYQPAPPSFTPTISTEAPHIIQEGQPITDRVTVGVKSGDHWIDGTSVTAKGYYFTGSKDAILKGISPSGGINSDADIASYPGRVRSGGEYPWVAGVGVRYGLIGPDPARGRVMATQTLQGQGGKGDGGRPGVCATGGEGWAAGMPLRTTSRFCLSPVEPGLVRGQDGFVVFFRSVGQEDRRLPHFESHLVQGQQYPGSFASEVFPADKQDRRVRSCGLDHSFTLVEVGYAGVPQQFPQGRNTRLRGSLLRVFDGPQLAEE